MEDQIAKSIELLRNSIEKLGEQGIRLYPEMVRLFVFSRVIEAALWLLAFLIAVTVTRVSWKAEKSTRRTDEEFPAAGAICAIASLVAFATGIATLCTTYDAARAVYAPEAAFLLSLIGK